MLGKDLIMQTLLGGGSSGGGSSGGGGGGSAAVSPKEVNFYDYDGTCVHAYTVAEAQALSELPAGPEHPGLVFQGWNWSLEGVKGLTRAMNIGAMYTTDDGTTRLYITLQEGRTSPMLGVGVNGTVTVDWGDGTEPDVLTGTSLGTEKWTSNHTYSTPGNYVIRLTVDGEMNISGSASFNAKSFILRHSSGADARNECYQRSLKKVEMGIGARLSLNAFDACCGLQTISIANHTTMPAANVFYDCRSLRAINIPDVVSVLQEGTLYGCAAISSVTLPESITLYGKTSFMNCGALSNMLMPADVTTIGVQAFYGIKGIAYFDFTACKAIPTLSATNAFQNIPDDCEIRVPAALYDEWIAATNWSTYADYIKAY